MRLLLFVLHIGLTTLTSTMKTTAAIMIAARLARGIKLKYGVRNNRAKITNTPETHTKILYQKYTLLCLLSSILSLFYSMKDSLLRDSIV